MFSLRAFMLMALTIYLLPTDPEQQRRFMEHANSAATWAATFCDRNEATCTVAGDAWADMKHKATFAAGMVYDVAMRAASGAGPDAASTSTSVIPAGFWTEPRPTRQDSKGTLTPEDLKPVWRGHPMP